MTPPWFVRYLPQRDAARHALRQFAEEEGEPDPVIVERYDGANHVCCIGTARDGREYGVAYEWTRAQLDRYLPRRAPQPVFDAPGRWPADVLVPLRVLRA